MLIYSNRLKLDAVMLAPLSKMLCGPRSALTLGSPTLRRPKGRLLLATRGYARTCWRTTHSITRYETRLQVDLMLMTSFQDPSKLLGFCSNKIISEAIQAAWFSNKKAMGVEYSIYFNPIPLFTLALTLTAVSEVIQSRVQY